MQVQGSKSLSQSDHRITSSQVYIRWQTKYHISILTERRKVCQAHQTDLTCSSDGADARESGAGFHSEAVSVTAIGLLRANA